MLKKFCTLRQSPLEINENIEILRSVENDIKVTVYSDNNITEAQAQNLWSNNVTSIFVDDPSEYF